MSGLPRALPAMGILENLAMNQKGLQIKIFIDTPIFIAQSGQTAVAVTLKTSG